MEHSLHLPPEDFDYVVGKNGLHAYALAFGPPIEACPHMQGSAFYYLVDSPEARQCKKCGDWLYVHLIGFVEACVCLYLYVLICA